MADLGEYDTEPSEVEFTNRLRAAIEDVFTGSSISAASRKHDIGKFMLKKYARECGVLNDDNLLPREVFIYGLMCPFSRQFFYVGASENPWKRLYGHLASPTNPRMDEWIANLKSLNRAPKLIILDKVTTDGSSTQERRWIKHLQAQGHPLTNQEAVSWPFPDRKAYEPIAEHDSTIRTFYVS